MDTVMSARPTSPPPRTPCLRPRPVWLSAYMRCTRLKDSASARSLAGSTPKASRLAKQAPAGNDRLSGPCCVTLRIVVSPVSARPAPLHGRASSVRCVGGVWLRPAPQPATGKRRELRPCPGNPSGEQNTIAPSNHRAKYRAGAGQLSEVRLRLLAYIHANERTQNPLLQMYWFR